MGLQQQVGDRCGGIRKDGVPADLAIGKDVTGERVTVGVQPAAGQPEDGVTHLDAAPIDHLITFDAADDEAGDVVVAQRVEARHLGGLPADQRATGIAAGGGDAVHHLGEMLRREPAGRVVVEEEERVGAAAEDVVDAVVDQVGADTAMAPGGDRHLHLGAHGIGARRQHRVLPSRGVEGEEAAEGADPTEHLRTVGGVDSPLDQGDGAISLVDVDPSVGVTEITHPPGSVQVAGLPPTAPMPRRKVTAMTARH